LVVTNASKIDASLSLGIAATAFVAPLVVLLSIRTIGYRGEQCGGGESVSQPPLKDKAFFDFAGSKPPFELPSKSEINPARASAIYPL
jgi:hypothetical protein